MKRELKAQNYSSMFKTYYKPTFRTKVGVGRKGLCTHFQVKSKD